MSRVDFKPATVDRLRRLERDGLKEVRDYKRQYDNTTTSKTTSARSAMTESRIYDDQIDWDYGSYKRLRFLAERGEVVAFNAELSRLDAAPREEVFKIFHDTGDCHLIHNFYDVDLPWVERFIIPLMIRKGIFDKCFDTEIVLVDLFHGPVEELIIDPRVSKQYVEDFFLKRRMETLRRIECMSKKHCKYQKLLPFVKEQNEIHF